MNNPSGLRMCMEWKSVRISLQSHFYGNTIRKSSKSVSKSLKSVVRNREMGTTMSVLVGVYK